MISPLARRILVALAAITLVTVATGVVPASAQSSVEGRIDAQQQELDRIKKQIDDHRQQTQKLSREEKAVAKKLTNIDREIDLSRSFLKGLKQQEELMSQRIDSLAAAAGSHSATLSARRAALAQRVRQMYMRDPTYRWEIIMGSEGIEQAVTRYRFMKVVAEQDAAMIADVRGRKMSIELQSAELTESLSELATVREESASEAKKLVQNRKARELALAQIRTQKTEHGQAIKELEKAQAEVRDLIGQLERRRLENEKKGVVATGKFDKLKGKLSWPVLGKVLRPFGQIKHPKYGTVTFNNGIDIQAAAGTPIVAVAPGSVEFVDWIDAYGKCIILNHGGGYYTLYAHLASTMVAMGKTVRAGEVIAEVGDTASLDGFVCHFEVRQAKSALNPMEWLTPRSGGASR